MPLRHLGLGRETKTEHTRCRARPPGDSCCHSRPEPSCPRLLRREKAVECRLAVPPARACRSKPCPAAPSRSARHRRLPRRQSPQSWGPAANLQPGGCELCQPTPQPQETAAEGRNKYDLMVDFPTPSGAECTAGGEDLVLAGVRCRITLLLSRSAVTVLPPVGNVNRATPSGPPPLPALSAPGRPPKPRIVTPVTSSSRHKGRWSVGLHLASAVGAPVTTQLLHRNHLGFLDPSGPHIALSLWGYLCCGALSVRSSSPGSPRGPTL